MNQQPLCVSKRNPTVKIIPVIDIKDRIVVRGVAGERDSYRPVQSQLTKSHAMIDIAEALRDAFDINQLYVADLDAILEQRPHFELYAELSRREFDLIIDAGLRDAESVTAIVNLGITNIVAGLETLSEPRVIGEMCAAAGTQNLIFSLDLKHGRPLIHAEYSHKWPNDPREIAGIAYACGIRRFIVLDLAAVGVESGPATLPLCEELRAEFPHIELITGGGIRGVDDLRTLNRCKIDGVLIASALHNGAITRDDLDRLERS